jgi:hypothetical protein
VLGKIDAVEYDGRPRKRPFAGGWYQLLNAGFRVPIVGGSGKDSNAVALGSPRTYARLPAGEAFTYAGWVNAVRAGRTFVSDGPVVTFDADGLGPGETLDVPQPGAPVRVRATARSVTPFDRLEVLAYEQVAGTAHARADGPLWTATTEASVAAAEPGWVAARCLGGAFAHTSPTYLRVAGRYRAEPTSRAALRRPVETTREWVELHGRFADPRSRAHLLGLCDAALERLGPATS